MDASMNLSFWIFLVPTLFVLIITFNMGFFSSNKMPVEGKTILITGGSEGMGLSAARQLSAKGANVILVARNVPKLQEALKAVQAAAKNPGSQRFHYISADVSSPSYAVSVVAEATAWNHDQALDIVWCVAGMSTPELFVDMEMSSLRAQMDINFYGTAEMSHAVLRDWLSPNASPLSPEPKHLVMTTSTVALFTIPGYAPYAPSKWAIRGLADSISQEVMMYPQPVKVHVVCPGTILTAGLEREESTKPEITKLLESGDPRQTPDKVAEAAIRGLERGDYYVTVNWFGDLQRVGVLGGMFRNNWFIDTLGAWIVPLIWFFVQIDLHGKIRSYGKKHGHPSTYPKNK